MNEKNFYFECYTVNKVTNCGSKIRANIFSAKFGLLPLLDLFRNLTFASRALLALANSSSRMMENPAFLFCKYRSRPR